MNALDGQPAIARNRVAVMHGVNLDQLGRRNPEHYGGLDFAALEYRIEGWATELGLAPVFFQTNHEGELVEYLHELYGIADGAILNPGAWTHYAYSLYDALEFAAVPTVEVHLSDVGSREAWRQVSVIRPACIATVSGQGPDGYLEALRILRKELS